MNNLFDLNPKKLGFGMMRLPQAGQAIDMQETQAMIDRFLEKGYTYFDTAYLYHGGASEEVAKSLLVDRHPRDTFTLATKMPVWLLKETADLQRFFDHQLEKTGAGYFDFYLLHSLSKSGYETCEKLGAWDFIREQKSKGLVRHIGFSFHDTAEVLDDILTRHPETEFVQLQINYADWESEKTQSRLCYEVARKHGKPVIIMEPLRGGMLANLLPDIRTILTTAEPETSMVEWALRFVYGLDGVLAVLSGMSALEQVEQNTALAENMRPLTDQNRQTLAQVVDALDNIDTIPCTSCGYCVENCPQAIATPDIIRLLNNYTLFNYLPPLKGNYAVIMRNTKNARAGDCIACGMCETVCPQNIKIIDALKTASATFD